MDQAFDWSQFSLQLAPTLVAIAAIIATAEIERRRLRATLVSFNRQKWIDKLRNDLSAVLASHMLVVAMMNQKREEIIDHIFRVTKLTYRIEMYLNPKEQAHVRLAGLLGTCMEQLANLSNDRPFNRDLFTATHHAILDAAKEILKSEWERVKRGD